jgi:hypothetical protein
LKHRSRNIAALTLVAILALPLSNVALGDERQHIYRSAYFLGRGDTGIATADGRDAIFYNPAGLAQGTGIYKETALVSPHVEFSKNSRDLYRQLSVEGSDETETLKKQVGKPQHLGIYNLTALVFRRAAIGALVSNQTNLLVSKSVKQGGLEHVNANSTINQAMTFSLAERFWSETLHLGITGKYINRGQGEVDASIIDAQDLGELNQGDLIGYGSGSGADFGMMLKFGGKKKFQATQSLGLTVENIGGTHMSSSDDAAVLTDLEQTVNVGYATIVGTTVSKFKFLVDYRDITSAAETNTIKKTHLGAELDVANFVGVCGGFNQGYPTAGLYVDIRFLRIDVGFYTQEMGELVGSYPDQRYFFRLMAGF